mmetsp:Transcript_18614/g.26242  ORF Transcript_18614/g.26242 Transcript_18614/m.26242 type:complete len:158 (+) Transcript_18614:113-586(+)
MANQAAKKAQKHREHASSVYIPLIIFLNFVFILFKGIFRRSSFVLRHKIGLIFSLGMYYLSYKGLVRGKEASSYYFDLFAITATSQILCMFSDKGWYLFLLIPSYFAFEYGKTILNSPKDSNAEEQKPKSIEEIKKDEKRAKKRERKEKMKGVKYLR